MDQTTQALKPVIDVRNLTKEYRLGEIVVQALRGINLQIDVPAVAPILQRLAQIGWPLFRDVEDAWYRAGDVEAGQRQFIVQDPDGYLVRLVQRLGERPVEQA